MKATWFAAAGWCLFLAGCTDLAVPVTPPVNGGAAPMPAPVAANPAGGQVRAWNQGEVEQWLRQDLKLVEVALTSTGGDNYSGQGRDAAGVSYQLQVRQVPGGIKCTYQSGDGGQGSVAFGDTVPDAGAPATTPAAEVDPVNVTIPDSPVAGRLHGQEFALTRAWMENGVLTIAQGAGNPTELSVRFNLLFKRMDEPLPGAKYQFPPDQAAGKPIVDIQWLEGGREEREHYSVNYTLVLEFGQPQNGIQPGRIYLALPDASQSMLSGTFEFARP